VAWLNSGWSEQLRAVAFLRWRLFVNSLRSVRGRLNLVSRGIAGLLVLGAALGGGLAIGAAAWGITREGKLLWLAIPFWVIFLFWQMFPVMATAFTQNVDTSSLLRFPLNYPSYFLLRMVYGALDIATALGMSWSLGLLAGIAAARLTLGAWAVLAVACFVVFNLLLARTIFAWIEHWLSRRRSREIMGVAFFLMMVGFQVAGPVLDRYSRKTAQQRFHVVAKLIPLEASLPPGLAAGSLLAAAQGRSSAALLSLAACAFYCGGALWLLHLRLHDQYRGEIAAEGEKRRKLPDDAVVRRGWKLPIFSGAISAVFEKELRYFSRSGPMLFTLLMPVVMIFVLWGGRKSLLGNQSGFFFPVGAAYCLLVMTNIVYNSFGGEGGGIQFYLFSPVSFRQITVAKNLAQLAVLVLEISILWLGVAAIYQAPRPRVLALTAAWLVFAVPANFAAGNLLSLYAPKRIEYATFGRQRASEITIFVSLGVQLAVIGVGALAIFVARLYSNLWVATLILAGLGVPSLTGYFLLLGRIDRIAQQRREVLTAELCRA